MNMKTQKLVLKSSEKGNIHIYIYTLTLQRPWIFGVFQEKKCIFSKSTFFEIKYCFSHVSDVHSWRYSWNCGNQIHLPHCQLATHCCRCHLCFGCLKVQEHRFPNYWFSFTCWMPWFRSSLLWVLDVLCSFIIARMRVGLNTHLRTCRCIAQFWWQLVLGRFAHTTQTCKGLFFFKRTFFLLRAFRTASESTEKCVQRTEISVRLGPVRAPFFSRPSVHPSKLFQQLAPQDQGEWMCSNPVYIFA